MWPCVTGDTSPLTRHSLNDTHCSAESSISTMSSPIALAKSHSLMQRRKDRTIRLVPYCRSFISSALSSGTCGLIDNTARWLVALLRRDTSFCMSDKRNRSVKTSKPQGWTKQSRWCMAKPSWQSALYKNTVSKYNPPLFSGRQEAFPLAVWSSHLLPC